MPTLSLSCAALFTPSGNVGASGLGFGVGVCTWVMNVFTTPAGGVFLSRVAGCVAGAGVVGVGVVRGSSVVRGVCGAGLASGFGVGFWVVGCGLSAGAGVVACGGVGLGIVGITMAPRTPFGGFKVVLGVGLGGGFGVCAYLSVASCM